MEMDTEEMLKEMEKLKPQLRIEYAAKCYRDNSPKDCHYLAHFMLSINKDSEKAATLFKTTCDEHKYAESCHAYADLIQFTSSNRQRSLSNDEEIDCFNYYRKGCEFGQAKSCFFTFLALFNGIARTSVLDEENADVLALKMLDRGCDLGSSESCYLAGGAHLVGIPGVLDKNVSTTYKYDVKACQLGNKLACNTLRGALPLGNPNSNLLKSNALQIRLMQLDIMAKREEERLSRLRPPQK